MRGMWGPTSFKDVLEIIWYYKWEFFKALLPIGIPVFSLGLGTGWLVLVQKIYKTWTY
ncbi:hypothetical protein [Bacillus mycoides]|nr:hypothetical protein [Bacillus mycoides]KUH43666.1 hypothetical protein M2E15_5899 [Bacillus mycoides]OSX95396.1 hypothetical protein BTJ44_01000 [Bacillus mycoides]OSY02676.1 hypothetical protein S2E19_03828 [Bacillus mycoides]OSY08167.1 hypothetical protein BTJ48_03120 [Bacillus mycoides]